MPTVTTTRDIALFIRRAHYEVLRDLRKLLDRLHGCGVNAAALSSLGVPGVRVVRDRRGGVDSVELDHAHACQLLAIYPLTEGAILPGWILFDDVYDAKYRRQSTRRFAHESGMLHRDVIPLFLRVISREWCGHTTRQELTNRPIKGITVIKDRRGRIENIVMCVEIWRSLASWAARNNK